MKNQDTHSPKVFAYFRVGNKSQLDADWPQPDPEKIPLDNRPEDSDDIDIKESDATPGMQMGG